MPNRLIKESICTSDTIDQLSFFEETCFYRLIVNCDDYGRMDARPAVLKSRLFPLKSTVTEKAVAAAINRMLTVRLVTLYEYEGRPYLQLTSWNRHQQIRAKKSKYPEPVNVCNHLISDDIKCSRNPIQSESNTISPLVSPPRGKPTGEGDPLANLPDGLKTVLEKWLAYKKERGFSYKKTGIAALINKAIAMADKFGLLAVRDIVEESISNGYQGIVWDRLTIRHGGKKQSQATEYPQRQYTDEQWQRLYVDLDKEDA